MVFVIPIKIVTERVDVRETIGYLIPNKLDVCDQKFGIFE